MKKIKLPDLSVKNYVEFYAVVLVNISFRNKRIINLLKIYIIWIITELTNRAVALIIIITITTIINSKISLLTVLEI